MFQFHDEQRSIFCRKLVVYSSIVSEGLIKLPEVFYEYRYYGLYILLI